MYLLFKKPHLVTIVPNLSIFYLIYPIIRVTLHLHRTHPPTPARPRTRRHRSDGRRSPHPDPTQAPSHASGETAGANQNLQRCNDRRRIVLPLARPRGSVRLGDTATAVYAAQHVPPPPARLGARWRPRRRAGEDTGSARHAVPDPRPRRRRRLLRRRTQGRLSRPGSVALTCLWGDLCCCIIFALEVS